MMYATHMVREEKGREVCRRLDYGFCRVRLPDHPDVPCGWWWCAAWARGR